MAMNNAGIKPSDLQSHLLRVAFSCQVQIKNSFHDLTNFRRATADGLNLADENIDTSK
jgi:hypothetical protein